MAGVVEMPEKTLKRINALVLPEWKICFLAGIIVGLVAHLYKITSWLPNWDSLVFRYDPQNMLGLGRWFLPVVCSFSSFYDLPFLNGIIAILFHSLSAVFICRILGVEKKITAILIGGVIVSFPTVTSVMMYNYAADGYSIAFFLSTIAAWLMVKKKPRYILASIFIALSTGIYQAYITVTIMLLLIKLIDDVIYKKASFVQIMKKGAYMLLSGVFGMALYTVVLKVLLAVFSVEMLQYQGLNTSVSLSGFDLWGSLYVIKETFMDCFFDISQGISVYVVLNLVVVAVTLAHYLKYIIINEIYKKPINLLVLVVLGVMLILGAGALAFLNPGIDYHNLMLMGYSVFYLFFIILYERGTDRSQTFTTIKSWIILLVTLLIIANQVVIANVSYHKAQMSYEKSYGVLIRIADRIEQTPNSDNCDKILVLGALENSESYSVNLTPDITGVTDGYIIRADDEIVGQSVLCSALSDYCEKDYEFISGEEKKALADRKEVKAMSVWPKSDSVSVIDDTVVIKLGPEGEN